MLLICALALSRIQFVFSFVNYEIRYAALNSLVNSDVNRYDWATRAMMELSCPLETTRRVPQEKFIPKPNKSFIDQAFSVELAGYWPPSFFASLWTSTPSRSINTQKENLASIQPS